MIRKIMERRLEEPDLGGRAHGKAFLFASFSANSFISWSAVPNTPDRKLCWVYARTSLKCIQLYAPFLVEQKTKVGFPTEYCCMVENNFKSRVLANWKSFCPCRRCSPTTCRVSLHARKSSPNYIGIFYELCEYQMRSIYLINKRGLRLCVAASDPGSDVCNVGDGSRNQYKPNIWPTKFHSRCHDFERASSGFVQNVNLEMIS